MENRRSANNEMFREVWEEIENRKVDKARIAEVERKRGTKGKKENEKREEFRRPTTEEEIVIARIVEEKEEERNEKEDLIELRTVEEMVPRQFHKYLRRKS